jgi:hypothetical protein
MDGKTVYFDPIDDNESAWYFAHFYQGDNSVDVKMTKNSNGKHYCTVPNGYTSVVFARMNPNYSEITWDNNKGYWNKTVNLTLPTNGDNCFNASWWDNGLINGNWTKINDSVTPSETTTPVTTETFYLVGWINGGDSWGETYKFVNGSLTVTFNQDSYVVLKDNGNNQYWPNSYVTATSADFYKDSRVDKMFVPGGVQLTFTVSRKNDNTLTMSYTTGSGTGGGGGTTDDNKLYVGTTFYDYRSDHELGNGKLFDRNWFDLEDLNAAWDCWYIFRKLNSKCCGLTEALCLCRANLLAVPESNCRKITLAVKVCCNCYATLRNVGINLEVLNIILGAELHINCLPDTCCACIVTVV